MQELQQQIQSIKAQIETLMAFKAQMEGSSSLPLGIDTALSGRGYIKAPVSVSQGGTGASTLTGVIQGNGTGAFTSTVPTSGAKTYFVALSSGGSPTQPITITDGVLTSG